MKKINYKKILCQILPLIRKKKSQAEVSRLLNFKHNQVYRWESGRVEMKWSDFVDYCKVCNVPLDEILKDTLTFQKKYKDTKKFVSIFLKNINQTVISKNTSLSRERIGRILRGKTDPAVYEVFMLLDQFSNTFFAFLYQIVEGKEIPVLKNQMSLYKKQKDLFFKKPWLSLVCCSFDMPEYMKLPEHSSEWVSQQTKLPISIIESTLKELQAAELIIIKNKKYVTKQHRFTPRGSKEERKNGFLFFNALTYQSIHKQYAEPGMRTSWNVFNLPEDAYHLIVEKYDSFLRDITFIITDLEKRNVSSELERQKLYVMCLNLVNLEGLEDSKHTFKIYEST